MKPIQEIKAHALSCGHINIESFNIKIVLRILSKKAQLRNFMYRLSSIL